MKCPQCKKEFEGEVREGFRCLWCGRVIHAEDIEEFEKLGEEEELLSQIENGTLTFPVVTMQYLPGFEIVKLIGPVYGLTVRSRGFGGRFVAGVEAMVGGEITAYVSECAKARNESLARLIRNAKKIGANAVIKVDFETSTLYLGMVLFSAYGTAIVAKPSDKK